MGPWSSLSVACTSAPRFRRHSTAFQLIKLAARNSGVRSWESTSPMSFSSCSMITWTMPALLYGMDQTRSHAELYYVPSSLRFCCQSHVVGLCFTKNRCQSARSACCESHCSSMASTTRGLPALQADQICLAMKSAMGLVTEAVAKCLRITFKTRTLSHVPGSTP